MGQVVKTIETIRKTDYLWYLHYLLDNLIKQLNQNKFNFDYNLECLPFLFPFPYSLKSYNKQKTHIKYIIIVINII